MTTLIDSVWAGFGEWPALCSDPQLSSMTSPRRLSRSLFDRILNSNNRDNAHNDDHTLRNDADNGPALARSPLAPIDQQAFLPSTQAMTGPTLTSPAPAFHQEPNGKQSNLIGKSIVPRRSSYTNTDDDAFPPGSSQGSVQRKRSQ